MSREYDIHLQVHPLYENDSVTILASDLLRLKLLHQIRLVTSLPCAFERRIVGLREFRELENISRRERGKGMPGLVWCLVGKGCSVVLIRQGHRKWLVLGIGDRETLASSTLVIESYLRDSLTPLIPEIHKLTIQPKSADSSLISMSAARLLFTHLQTSKDLEAFSSLAPGSGNVTELLEDVKKMLSEVSGMSRRELERIINDSEEYMARMYLETTLDSVSLNGSKPSSIKTTSETVSKSHSFLENPHFRTSSDQTSGRLSLSSWPGVSRTDDPPLSQPQPAISSAEESYKDDDDESIPSEQDARVITSPQAASSESYVGWPALPPLNRVPETETLERYSEESESRNEMVFIEYSYLSPKNLQPPPNIQMSEISEDAEEEEARTQVDPCLMNPLTYTEYGEALLSTTPKFRTTFGSLDPEESRSHAPVTLASCDFTSVKLESPCSHSPPRLMSPRGRGYVTFESESTLGKVSEEPERNEVKVIRVLKRTEIYMENGDPGAQKTCGVQCHLL